MIFCRYIFIASPARPAVASAAPAELDEEPAPEQSSTSTIDAPNTSAESQAAGPAPQKRRKKPKKKSSKKRTKRNVAGPTIHVAPPDFDLSHRHNDEPSEVEES